jgi:hypothetical protein
MKVVEGPLLASFISGLFDKDSGGLSRIAGQRFPEPRKLV